MYAALGGAILCLKKEVSRRIRGLKMCAHDVWKLCKAMKHVLPVTRLCKHGQDNKLAAAFQSALLLEPFSLVMLLILNKTVINSTDARIIY